MSENVKMEDHQEEPIKGELVDQFNPNSIKPLKYKHDQAVQVRDGYRDAAEELLEWGDGGSSARALGSASNYEARRKAALWDSSQHYKKYQRDYEEMAIDDAVSVGKTIKFGGETYKPSPQTNLVIESDLETKDIKAA